MLSPNRCIIEDIGRFVEYLLATVACYKDLLLLMIDIKYQKVSYHIIKWHTQLHFQPKNPITLLSTDMLRDSLIWELITHLLFKSVSFAFKMQAIAFLSLYTVSYLNTPSIQHSWKYLHQNHPNEGIWLMFIVFPHSNICHGWYAQVVSQTLQC